MVYDSTRYPRVLTIYLELSNYPILAPRIRERMRQELIKRRVIDPQAFEAEVELKAIQSQKREGLNDPCAEESMDAWIRRQAIIRDNLTDFYFAHNLPHELFEKILREVLEKRLPPQEIVLSFHPELAPMDMLFAQAEGYEALPQEEQQRIYHHLQEIKVVLIKAMVSDHLDYIGIAKEWFDISDLKFIEARRLGRGKIGGKAGGVILADAILRKSIDQAEGNLITIPQSWFIGSDVFYQFTQLNNLLEYSNQKYKSEDEVRNEYPQICESFQTGSFPEEVIAGLRSVLMELGPSPLIVRSSSLLEDSFGTSFAGKYESFFCSNQGRPDENLQALKNAISLVYASVYSPNVILYRNRMGLLDYDERMAILIQEVKGRQQGRYFLPDMAGVGFSRNQFRWNPRIDRNEGFLRLVWGLGTRAVESFEGDYPRLVALSHPTLRPDSDARHIHHYSQHFVDLIDLDANAFRTLPISQVINSRLHNLCYIAQHFSDDLVKDFLTLPINFDPQNTLITFDLLLRETDFPQLMRTVLHLLENAYLRPIDIEFVLELAPQGGNPLVLTLHLLQCRPQSRLPSEEVQFPTDVPTRNILLMLRGMVPDGIVKKIRYTVFIDEQAYHGLEMREQNELARLVGRINAKLSDQLFILIGPGRWGSVNTDLGIPVTFGDLYHACALVEVVSEKFAIEPSYGTHFFQDLVEAHIFTLALSLDDQMTVFNWGFFLKSNNVLSSLLPEDASWSEIVHIIDMPAVTHGKYAELVMDGNVGMAIVYLKRQE